MITLRPYQSGMVMDARKAFKDGHRAPLLVSPTGSGKTVMFAEMTRGAAKKGKRIYILAHRVELVDQIVDALREADVEPSIIAAGYPEKDSTVAVASVQTLVRRLAHVAPPDLLVCDEAHHVANGNTWSAIFQRWPNAYHLGVTATPVRLDGRGLGEHFDHMIVGPSTQWLIDNNYLTKPRVFSPPSMNVRQLHMRMGDYVKAEAIALSDRPSVTGDALTHYRRYAHGKPALAFCCSVEHAEHVAEDFRKGGYQAIALNGGSHRDYRRQAVADFKRGALQLMASCDLFSEGFDSPGVHVGIMLRPTASVGLYLQQVGRCLRVAPGKAEALILDHADNTRRFGLPNEPRDWALTRDESDKEPSSKLSARVCANCFAANSVRAKACTECGTLFPIEPRFVEQRKGELIEVDPAEFARRREARDKRIEVGRAKSFDELLKIEKLRKYKPGWARHVWAYRPHGGDGAA